MNEKKLYKTNPYIIWLVAIGISYLCIWPTGLPLVISLNLSVLSGLFIIIGFVICGKLYSIEEKLNKKDKENE